MPIDPSIYSQLRPTVAPEGPADQYAKMISLKSLMGNEQLNEMQRTKLARDMKEEEDFKNLYAGATPEEMNAPDFYRRAVGTSPLRAVQMQKSLIEQKTAEAKLFQTKLETGAKALELHRDELNNVNTPQEAAQWVKSAFTDPTLAPLAAHGGTLEQALARIPTDPAQFADWKRQSSLGAAKLLELNQQLAAHKETERHNRESEDASKRANRVALAHLDVSAATADPFGILGIKDIAAGARGGASPATGTVTPSQVLNGPGNALSPPAAAPQQATPQSTALTPPPEAGKGASVLPSGDWKKLMGTDVHGDEFLKSLPANIIPQIKAYAEGRKMFPAGFAEKSPYFQALMQMVGQYDPSFDQTNYNGRAKTYASFTGGPDAEKVKNINQTLHHAGQLGDAIDKLDNFNGMATPLNLVVNPVEKFFGDTRQGVFEQKAQAVASELRKVYAGSSGGGLTELKKWEESLPVNASKEQQKAYLESGMELLNGALSAMQEKYQAGMGPRADVGNLLKPEARAILQRLAPGAIAEKPKQTASGPITVTPTQSDIDAELRRRGVIK